MKVRDNAIQKWPGWLSLVLLSLLARPGAVAQQPLMTQAGKDAQILIETGQKAYEQGHYEDALRAYSKVIVLSATSPETAALAQLKIGNVYMAQRKFDPASASFQRAITLNPNYALAHNNLGEALGESRQYNRALDAFNRAVAIDPQLLRARYNIGITYGRLGNLKYAEFVFRILVRDHPDYDLGCDGLAVTLARSGRAKEAIPLHQKAISLNPNEPSYYYNLALSYLIIGDTANALEQQKKLQVLAPEVASQLASAIVKHQLR